MPKKQRTLASLRAQIKEKGHLSLTPKQRNRVAASNVGGNAGAHRILRNAHKKISASHTKVKNKARRST